MKNLILLPSILLFAVSCFPSKKAVNDSDFKFEVSSAFYLAAPQIAITGKVKSGEIHIHEKLKIKINNSDTFVNISKMEIFAKPNQTDVAYKDDFVSFTVSGIDKSRISPGMIITK